MTMENENKPEQEDLVELTLGEMSPLKQAMELKKAKKKARKKLQSEGFPKAAASKLVKTALKRIVSNKPVRKAAGRGR